MVTNTSFLLKMHDIFHECATKINGVLTNKQNYSDIFLFPFAYSFIPMITHGVPGQNKTVYYIVSDTIGDAEVNRI